MIRLWLNASVIFKAIAFFLCLLALSGLSGLAHCQTILASNGSNGSVRIGNSIYPSNSVVLDINGNYVGIWIKDNYLSSSQLTPVVKSQLYSSYVRSGGVAFASVNAIKSWADSFACSSGSISGGGSSLTSFSITVTGGEGGSYSTGTATVPPGTVVKSIAVKNTSFPTDPTRDDLNYNITWNVVGTTLTIYMWQFNGIVTSPVINNYLVTGLY